MGEHEALAFVGVSEKKSEAKLCGRNRLGVANLNNLGGLWAVVPSCLVPRPW